MSEFSLPPRERKEEVVQNMFTSAASAYDLNNSVLSLGQHHRWKRLTIALVGVGPGHVVVDLCGGTADLSLLAAEKAEGGGLVMTVDLNMAMLKVGLSKARTCLIDGLKERKKRARPVMIQANAESIPLPDGSVDRLVVGFGLRNVTNLEKALSEIHRILKPGGRFACLEFSHPVNAIWDGLYRFYSFYILPKIGQWISRDNTGIYEYLPASIARFPDQEAFRGIILKAGFSGVTYRNLSGGIVAIHLGEKNNG